MKYLIMLQVVCLPFIFGLPNLYTTRIIIKSGSAFSQHVIPGIDERITACVLEYADPQNNETKKVGLKLNEIQTFDDIGLRGRLSNLGRGVCGFSLIKFTTKDPTNFTILIDYEDSQATKSLKLDFAAFCYEFTDEYPLNNLTRFFKIGESRIIPCSTEYHTTYACMLHNASGELVARGIKSCAYSIQHISMDDIGAWKCSLSLRYSMQHFDSFILVKLKGKIKVDVWYKEENMHGMIGCKYDNPETSKPENCFLINPEHTVYTISNQSASTGRYTTLGTNLNQLTCQIEFPLPMLQIEKGIWKCVVGPTGGFINTDEANTLITLKDQIQYAELNKSLNVECFVPFSAETCIITSPDGKVYYGGNVEKFHKGECGTKIENFQPSQTGTWTCRFSRANFSADDVVKIEVKLIEGVSGFPEIEVANGGSAELKCKFNSPIYFCSFIDPLGNSYNVHPNKTTDYVQYIGGGLETGDCGIKINQIQSNQAGEWRCVATISDSLNILEFKTRIVVDSGLVATASTIGIPVGIMVGAVVLLGVALFKRFRNTKKNKQRNSHGSATSMTVISNANTVTYTA